MLSSTLTSFLAAIGASAWIYAKVYRSSGANNKSALIVGGISFGLIFILMLILTNIFFN